MIKACDISKADIVKLDGSPYITESISVQTPSARGSATLYKVRFRNVATQQKVDKVFRGDDVLDEADFERRDVQFSYADAMGCTFMDLEDFSQFTLSLETLGGQKEYLTEGMEGIKSLCSDGKVLGIELPPVVELEIVETDPSMKGASVTSRNKPAKLSTGLVVQVPEYISTGTVIRVDTRTGEFVSRA